MEIFRDINLLIHVAAGFTALFVGIFAFASHKGGKVHRLSGKVYVGAMVAVALTAFVLSLLRFSPFLFMVGAFSLHMTLTGYRGLIKKKEKTQQASPADWTLLVFSAAAAATMAVWTLIRFSGTPMAGLMPVTLVFALLLGKDITEDLRIYTGKKQMRANDWLLYHISRISGAYIATLTAFLVINVQTDPVYIAWLLPTVLGLPVILFFKRKYGKKTRPIKVSTGKKAKQEVGVTSPSAEVNG
jgi:uncharacterized membrane protein